MEGLEFIFVIIEMFAIIIQIGLSIFQIITTNKFEKEVKQKLYDIEIENKVMERNLGFKMNNIDILERFCEIFRLTQKSLDEFERDSYGDIIGVEEIEGIENLIQENKELKE